jgi:putative alpha-1,2-mannosidase
VRTNIKKKINIFTTLGFYPVNPFDGAFVLGAAQVKNAVVHVGKGKTLRIEHKKGEQQTLNGKLITQPSIRYEELIEGDAVLTF